MERSGRKAWEQPGDGKRRGRSKVPTAVEVIYLRWNARKTTMREVDVARVGCKVVRRPPDRAAACLVSATISRRCVQTGSRWGYVVPSSTSVMSRLARRENRYRYRLGCAVTGPKCAPYSCACSEEMNDVKCDFARSDLSAFCGKGRPSWCREFCAGKNRSVSAMDLPWLTWVMAGPTLRLLMQSWTADVSQHWRFLLFSWMSWRWPKVEVRY